MNLQKKYEANDYTYDPNNMAHLVDNPKIHYTLRATTVAAPAPLCRIDPAYIVSSLGRRDNKVDDKGSSEWPVLPWPNPHRVAQRNSGPHSSSPERRQNRVQNPPHGQAHPYLGSNSMAMRASSMALSLSVRVMRALSVLLRRK